MFLDECRSRTAEDPCPVLLLRINLRLKRNAPMRHDPPSHHIKQKIGVFFFRMLVVRPLIGLMEGPWH